jgi:hypothetical protein
MRFRFSAADSPVDVLKCGDGVVLRAKYGVVIISNGSANVLVLAAKNVDA